MDVRCEKCQTEYELDEARLKPGGVTVKCTTCGHMFKIRKRSPTQSGIPATPPVPAPRAKSATPVQAPPRMPAAPEAVPRAQTGSGPVSGPMASGEGERNWIIRLDNGETRTCRELNALQQWIIAGQVSRESMISRSGKTWKRLGDIAELASFFIVAEEARQSRNVRESGSITPPRLPVVTPEPRPTIAGMGAVQPPPRTAPERETVVEPVRAPTQRPAPPAAPPAPPPRPAAPAVVALPPLGPPSAPPPAAGPRGPLATAPTMMHAPAPPAPAPPAPAPAPIPPPANQRPTGAWASDQIAPIAEPEPFAAAGPSAGALRPGASPSPSASFGGDTFGGVVRPLATDDVAFAGGGLRLPPADSEGYDPFLAPKKSGAGMWIALGSLVVIGAAAAVVYFMFLRAPAKKNPAENPPAGDAGAQVAEATDGGVAVTPVADGGAAVEPATDKLAEARTQLGRDVAPSLIAADQALAAATDGPSLGMRARLLTAQAQIIEDEAGLADPKAADKIRRDGKKLTLDALALAQRSIKGGGALLGNLAMADVLRLQGKPAKDINRYLDAARQAQPTADDTRELQLVSAQVALRDHDWARAAELLKVLDADGAALDDVRPRWLSARLAFATKKNDAARAAAEAILAAQPDHAGAKALLAKVSGVDTTDDMPPEVGPGSGSGSGSGSGAGSSTGSGNVVVPSGAGEPYDKLVAKANKLAEVDCGQAMQYFAKALEDKPAGVEALVGMGYCYIDAKQFSSANTKFRTALALSPRNRDALRGVAENYQQQGRTDLAIEAYKRYLEIYPDDDRIKRQVERLGGGGPGPTPPENDGSGGSGSAPGSGSAGSDKPADPPKDPAPPTDPSPPTTP